MNTARRRKLRRKSRKGTAVVEFAICLPLIFLIGFGFINCGVLVQMKHNSKIIGHMAATDVFQQQLRDSASIMSLEQKYELLAADLGFVGLDVSIEETNDIAVVTTTMSVGDNSPIPIKFQTADTIVTETHVYAPFDN